MSSNIENAKKCCLDKVPCVKGTMTGKHEQKHNSWLHIDTHKCVTFWYLSCNNENGCEQGVFIGSPQMKKGCDLTSIFYVCHGLAWHGSTRSSQGPVYAWVSGDYLEDEGLADFAGGVIGGVLVLGEASRLHDGGNNGVPEHHLYGGGGDGGEAEGAHLPLQRQVHVEVAGGGERAVHTGRGGGEGYEVGALSARAGREREQLVGRAGLGEQDEDVPGEQRADVAVQRVDGGEEAGPRDAQRRQRLRGLARHDPRLADAREEDGPRRVDERLRERRRLRHVEAVEEVVQVPALRAEERGQVRRRHRRAVPPLPALRRGGHGERTHERTNAAARGEGARWDGFVPWDLRKRTE
jgi:hypothetical protein